MGRGKGPPSRWPSFLPPPAWQTSLVAQLSSNPTALIQIRDRLATHAEGPAPKAQIVRLSQSALSALMLTEAIPPRVGRAKRTSASTRAPTTSYCLAVPSCPNRTPNLGLHGSSGRSSTLISATALASLWPAKASERSIGLLWERPDIRDRTDGPGSKRQRFLPRGS